jgi:hypothetical protein
MFNSRNKLIGMVGALATTAAVAITGMTGASAASHAPRSSASVSGTEQFQLMTTSATSNTASFVALGKVFTAGGVDHQGNKVDTIVLPGGTFRIRHFNGKVSQHFNPKTCLGVISGHGPYKILGGTGKYKGISGHGTYQLSIVLIAARAHGACSQSKAVSFQQVIKGKGPVKL